MSVGFFFLFWRVIFILQRLCLRQQEQPSDEGSDRAAFVESRRTEPLIFRPPPSGHGERHLPEVNAPTLGLIRCEDRACVCVCVIKVLIRQMSIKAATDFPPLPDICSASRASLLVWLYSLRRCMPHHQQDALMSLLLPKCSLKPAVKTAKNGGN